MIKVEDIVTPKWLTQVLSEAGILTEGSVSSVFCRSHATTTFQFPKITFLSIRYEGVNNSPPSQMVLKVADGIKEKAFFTDIAPLMINDAIIRCYNTNHWLKNEQSYLLFEDLSQTHFQTDWPIPPVTEQCIRSVSSLAKIHAFWWNHTDLADKLQKTCEVGTCWNNRIDLAATSIVHFFDFIGDRLSLKRKLTFEKVLSSSNQRWRPRQTEHHQTLIHGDAHFWNFLYPKDESFDRVRIIDWNAWDIGRATDDIAYMIGLHWYPERRKALEGVLLHGYHDKLQEHNVQIAWDELWNEYQESIIMNLFIPVWQWRNGISSAIWWSHLERAFLSFEDLKCEEKL